LEEIKDDAEEVKPEKPFMKRCLEAAMECIETCMQSGNNSNM